MSDHTIHDGFQISGLYTTPTLKKVEIEAMMAAEWHCWCGGLTGYGKAVDERGGGDDQT